MGDNERIEAVKKMQPDRVKKRRPILTEEVRKGGKKMGRKGEERGRRRGGEEKIGWKKKGLLFLREGV